MRIFALVVSLLFLSSVGCLIAPEGNGVDSQGTRLDSITDSSPDSGTSSPDAGTGDGGVDRVPPEETPPTAHYQEWPNRSASTSGSFQYFLVYIPANTPALSVASWGGSGDGTSWANLYLSRGSRPTASLYDYASRSAFSNDETITVENPLPGLWWIGLEADSEYAGVTAAASF
jgi:hypothetical protein